jgi:hypothetical protein
MQLMFKNNVAGPAFDWIVRWYYVPLIQNFPVFGVLICINQVQQGSSTAALVASD